MPTIAELYQQILGRAPESQAVADYWNQMFGAEIDPSEEAIFQQAAAPELAARQQQQSLTADAPTAQTNTLSSLANTEPVTTSQSSSTMTPAQIEAQRRRTYASGAGAGDQAAALAQLPIETQKLFTDFADLASMKSAAENDTSRLGAQLGAKRFNQAGGQAALDAMERQIQSDPATAQIHADLTAKYGRTSFGDAFMREIAPMLVDAALVYTAGLGINSLAGAGGASASSATAASAASAGGTVGDMAAMYESALGLTPAEAMAAAEGALASGTTATQLAATLAEAGLITGSEIVALTGNAALGESVNSIIAKLATQIPTGTSTIVGGTSMTAEQIAALEAGGKIVAGEVIDKLGNVVDPIKKVVTDIGGDVLDAGKKVVTDGGDVLDVGKKVITDGGGNITDLLSGVKDGISLSDLLAGLTGIGASLYGANQASNSAAEAARIQKEASDAALAENKRQFDLSSGEFTRQYDLSSEELKRQYDLGQAAQMPWRTAGETALGSQMDLMGLGANGAAGQLSSLTSSPGYQFRLGEGTKALDRSASARGGVFSGAAGKALTEYGQNFATNEYGNRLSQLSSLSGQGQAAASNQAAYGQNYAGNVGSLGSNYAGSLANLGSNYAGNMSNLLTGGANAQGAATIAQGNARQAGILGAGTALSNLFNPPKQQQTLADLLRG